MSRCQIILVLLKITIHFFRTLVDIFLAESTENVYVENRTELMEVDVTQVDRLFGLFGEHHLLFDHERRNSSGCEPCQKWPDQPSLTEMTQKAIEMLQKNTEHGFFLLVEGGRIDHAHHDTYVKFKKKYIPILCIKKFPEFLFFKNI